jgi:hypothetical protein
MLFISYLSNEPVCSSPKKINISRLTEGVCFPVNYEPIHVIGIANGFSVVIWQGCFASALSASSIIPHSQPNIEQSRSLGTWLQSVSAVWCLSLRCRSRLVSIRKAASCNDNGEPFAKHEDVAWRRVGSSAVSERGGESGCVGEGWGVWPTCWDHPGRRPGMHFRGWPAAVHHSGPRSSKHSSRSTIYSHAAKSRRWSSGLSMERLAIHRFPKREQVHRREKKNGWERKAADDKYNASLAA